MSSITLLGTGTCQIELERRASSVLIELDGMYVLFDCGHGVVQRLLDVGVQHKDVEHIIVSHFHPDHVSDLIPFLHAGAWSRRDPRSTDLHIYGPPGVQKLMEGFVDIFGLHAFQQASYHLVAHEINEGQINIGPHHLDFIDLPPAGNHGVRFDWKGRQYAMTGDSDFHEAEVAFLKNVDLAIIDSGHITDDEIVQLAVVSQAKMIVCSHLYRELDVHYLQAVADARGYRGTIVVGRDLMTFVL